MHTQIDFNIGLIILEGTDRLYFQTISYTSARGMLICFRHLSDSLCSILCFTIGTLALYFIGCVYAEEHSLLLVRTTATHRDVQDCQRISWDVLDH